MKSTDTSSYDTSVITQNSHTIYLTYAEYRLICRDYTAIVERRKSFEGQRLLQEHYERDKECDRDVNALLNKLGEMKYEIELETRSIASRSVRSGSSSVRSKAKVETVKSD